MALVIDIRDNVTAGIAAIKKTLHHTNMNPAIGAAEVRLFQDHFAKLPANKSGYPTGHYWGDAAKATTSQVMADGVRLTVALPGINMHATGIPNIIRPINAKNLAIPAIGAAYGRSPREFGNLRCAFRRVGGRLIAFALVEKSETRGDKQPHSLKTKQTAGQVKPISQLTRTATGTKRVQYKVQTGAVIFWLVKQVHTHKYPGVVPTEEEMMKTATDTATMQLEQLKLRNRR